MNLVYAIVAPIVFAVAAPMVMQMLGGAAGGLSLPSLRHMLRGGILMMPPSKHYGLAGAAAMTAATSGAGAGAAAVATGAGGPGAGGVATSSVGVMAPVVGTTTLYNPIASQLMRQRMMQTTAPATVVVAGASKPMIKEVKHPRLSMAYHITKAAIIGKPPEYELSRKEKAAYYALKYTVGRTIRNIRQATNTFRHGFYLETGIWIPGRLPREHEVRKAAEVTYKAGKWMREKGAVLFRKTVPIVKRIYSGINSSQVGKRGDLGW